jgi:hypothetical protein
MLTRRNLRRDAQKQREKFRIRLSVQQVLIPEEEFSMTDNRVRVGEKKEDQFTAMLEAQTSGLPSSLFLGAAFASILGSLTLKLSGKNDQALFVGQWAAPFLLLGIYNKMVKQHGSDSSVGSAESFRGE